MKERNLVCVKCGKKYSGQPMMYQCPQCGGILSVERIADRSFQKGSFDNMCEGRFPGLWRYWKFLPVNDPNNIVTLGEGLTPLIRAENIYSNLGIKNLYLKNEFANPTASFKDRPTAVGISVAKEQGISEVAVASTGNAGVSAAAYAAKAGMKCLVCAPESTAKGKVAQLRSYGANIFFVNGTYSDCFKIVKDACRQFGYANLTSTYVNPYTVEGDRTVAYELYEQLKGRVPDWIIVPIGTGPLLSGIWRGYKELLKLGDVCKLPKMVGVQAENCQPVARAFRENRKCVAQIRTEYTIAGGIADQLVGYEKDGDYTIQQIRESGGCCVTLSEEEIFEAWLMLCRKEGIFSEPASAAAVGAVKKLMTYEEFKKDDMVVSMVTSHGLKYPDLPSRLEDTAIIIKDAGELKA